MSDQTTTEAAPLEQQFCPRCNAPTETEQAVCAVCALPLDAATIQAFNTHMQQRAAHLYVQPAVLVGNRTATARMAVILGSVALVLLSFCAGAWAVASVLRRQLLGKS